MYQLSDDDSTFGEQPILVHRGFNGVFLLYDDILERLEDLGLNDTAPLYVNGHSLGGANAQLFAAYYAFAHPQRSVYLTTFGQPRVGSKGFKLFAERLRNLNVWRIVLEDDIITRIPFSEYVHTGHLLWKSYRQEFVQSFYRQIGSSLKNLKGVLDFSLAVLKGLESDPDSVQDLILDHFMGGYLEWMESACRGDASNFTTDFERLA
jgi:pimeloyl-ACP methyl ester carboxylesterase